MISKMFQESFFTSKNLYYKTLILNTNSLIKLQGLFYQTNFLLIKIAFFLSRSLLQHILFYLLDSFFYFLRRTATGLPTFEVKNI